MRRIRFILKKEFLQIMRNKQMLPIILVMPFLQLILLAYAATFEIDNIDYAIVDFDRTQMSRRLAEDFSSSAYFTKTAETFDVDAAEEAMLRREAKVIIIIPRGFERDLMTGHKTSVQFLVNSEDGQAAGVMQAYSQRVLAGYSLDVVAEFRPTASAAGIMTHSQYWYNPELNYKHYMVPGILVILITVVGMFLSSMSIVKEKEIGTIEQINVTPIRKHEFIIGKLLPFWLIALIELALGLAIGKVLYDIPIEGSLPLLFAVGGIYMLVVLAVGLFVSTVTNTQQQAMFIAWFFMVIFILMSGLFTPIDSMPEWAQHLTRLNPVAYFVEIMRRVLMKGAGPGDIAFPAGALAAYAVAILSLSVWRYRKTS